jgi:hypothetical protein
MKGKTTFALAAALVAAASAFVFIGAGRGGDASALPPSSLAFVSDGRTVEWWRSADAPSSWRAPLPSLVSAVRWHDEGSAVSWGELSLEGTGEAKHTGVILARIDPARVSLKLDAVASGGLAPIGAQWSLPAAPPDALLAVNAGQFTVGGAWGWVVRGGREYQVARPAPLAPAIVIDADGRVQIVQPGAIDSAARSGRVAEAFQSYPMLLADGAVPAPLRRADGGIDVAHRDARLALGVLADGRLLVALTRFEGLGGKLQLLPLGLTTPEMAALMGALGCRDAVLLDGGVSGQLAVRDAAAGVHRWAGLRRVPLGLVALPAADAGAAH